MTGHGDVGIIRIRQVSVSVHDLERAIEFYRDRLELPLQFRVPGLAVLDCGGVRIVLSAPERQELEPPGSILYFEVQDIKHAHEAMVAHGVQFEDEPHMVARVETHDVWMTFFRDPDQNLLALTSDVPRT